MSKELVISAGSHERRVAILEEGQLVEIYIEREKEFALVGSIYKGKVTRVLPGMQSAFVDIGLDGDAFLYVSDVFENLEDYDHGQPHGDAPAPALAAPGEPAIEVLPGETLAAAGVHEEVHLDEETEDRGGPEEREGREEYRAHEPDALRRTGQRNRWPARRRTRRGLGSCRTSRSASRIPTLPLRRILLPPTTPRGIIRRASETTAARGRTVAGIAETVAIRRGRGRGGRWGRRRGGSGDRDRGGRHHGQGGRNLPPSKFASPQGERDSRGFDNRATIAVQVIAARALRSNGEKTTSSCRANRSPSIAGVRCHRRSSRWGTTSPRSVSLILKRSPRARQSACSRTPAFHGVSPEACHIGF